MTGQFTGDEWRPSILALQETRSNSNTHIQMYTQRHVHIAICKKGTERRSRQSLVLCFVLSNTRPDKPAHKEYAYSLYNDFFY